MTIPAGVRTVVFDLDGTLYFNRDFSVQIMASAAELVSARRSISREEAGELLRQTKRRLKEETGRESSLTAACEELGVGVRELHAHFTETLRPEEFLAPEPQVISLLARLARRYRLVLYTNNNLVLTGRILSCIGCESFFDLIYTIETSWEPKPHRPTVEKLLQELGLEAGDCLFVGDRRDIDLRLPGEMGAAVHLTGSLADLLSLDTILEGDSA